jgi:hypothetical protein
MRAAKRGSRVKKRRRGGATGRIKAGARLTFRAEVMPGRGAAERTFTVARVLAGGRVELVGLSGQHAVTAFELLRP